MAFTFLQNYLIFATVLLLYNTYKDLKKMEVDSRFNFMASGALVMLIFYFSPSFLRILIPIIISSITVAFFAWRKFYASGDLEAVAWVLVALGIMDYIRMIIFLVLLTAFYTFGLIMLKLTKRTDNKLPGYPSILGSFILSIISFAFL